MEFRWFGGRMMVNYDDGWEDGSRATIFCIIDGLNPNYVERLGSRP